MAVVPALVLLLAAACSGDPGTPSRTGAATGSPTPAGSSPGPSTEVFPSTPRPTDGAGVEVSADEARSLKKGDCVRVGGPPAETDCDAADAVARVLATGRDTSDPLSSGAGRWCPDDTDHPLGVYLDPQPGPSGAPATYPSLSIRLPVGYVCLRNLRGPHPGKPGAGGGVLTIDDCVNDDSGITEVPCDGDGDSAGGKRAEYKVTRIADRIVGGSCPRGRGRIAFRPPREFIREYCARRLS